MKNRRNLMVARRLRAAIHPSMLIVTVREGEERGICSPTLEVLLRIVKDQVEEGSVVVIVLNKESKIWREASMKTLSHDAQLKYVDVDGTRVVTNNRCIGEQIKNDRVENAVMDGVNVGNRESYCREKLREDAELCDGRSKRC